MATDEGTPTGPRDTRRAGGTTRGFLFSDLRGYTAFVDSRGAQAAADLLDRYRALVRASVARHDGAEIGTEGDSFYVVFSSVSDALRCGLEIVAEAEVASKGPADAIRVGVGIHAGETVDTAEGYVGQPINVAARLCAIAAPGEVLVSDTVRSLTHGILPVQFVSRGRRRLKGVAEPLAVYAVEARDAAGTPLGAARGLSRNRLLVVSAAAGALGLVAVTAFVGSRVNAPTPPATWKIGLSLPLTGFLAAEAKPLQLAVELALEDALAPDRLRGPQVVLDPRDDGESEFGENLESAAANAAAFVADPLVVAMIGALSSDASRRQIPITNEAGLLQCNPTNTHPGLTKPEEGALLLRSANPGRINYVRLPAATDVEAAAGAIFAINDLGAESALVIDDTMEVGRVVADGFAREFEAIGGDFVRRSLNPGANAAEILEPLNSGASAPSIVFFGGFTATGAADVRQAMVEGGHADVPFLGWDGLWDGWGADENSFIARAGTAAAGSYISHPTVGTVSATFEQRYRAAYGEPPAGLLYEYTAASYACTQILLQALASTVSSGVVTPESVREAVRARVVDRSNQFETVVGPVAFDENGDSIRQFVSFYRVEPAAADGAGDWVLVKHQDFGSAQ